MTHNAPHKRPQNDEPWRNKAWKNQANVAPPKDRVQVSVKTISASTVHINHETLAGGKHGMFCVTNHDGRPGHIKMLIDDVQDGESRFNAKCPAAVVRRRIGHEDGGMMMTKEKNNGHPVRALPIERNDNDTDI